MVLMHLEMITSLIQIFLYHTVPYSKLIDVKNDLVIICIYMRISKFFIEQFNCITHLKRYYILLGHDKKLSQI